MASYRSSGDVYYLETFFYFHTKQDVMVLSSCLTQCVCVCMHMYAGVFVERLWSCHLDRLFPCKQYKPLKHVSVMRIKGIV